MRTVKRYCEEFGQEHHISMTAENLIADIRTENEKLKKFARCIIRDECWDLGGSQSRDGADVQDWAESLGLIAKGLATQEDVDNWDGLFEVGDDFYTFTDILKE